MLPCNSCSELADIFVQTIQSHRQRIPKSDLFVLHNLRYSILILNQIWIRILHPARHGENHFMQKWVFCTHQTCMPNRSANDLAEYIASSLVLWNDSIRNQKCERARVIGNHHQRWASDRVVGNAPPRISQNQESLRLLN